MDRVTTFNSTFSRSYTWKRKHGSGFRPQTNPHETIEQKLTDRIPVRENQIDVRPKLPEKLIIELSSDEFPDDLLQVVHMNKLITMKQSGNFTKPETLATHSDENQYTKYIKRIRSLRYNYKFKEQLFRTWDICCISRKGTTKRHLTLQSDNLTCRRYRTSKQNSIIE